MAGIMTHLQWRNGFGLTFTSPVVRGLMIKPPPAIPFKAHLNPDAGQTNADVDLLKFATKGPRERLREDISARKPL